jgi:hypothetical protein
MSFFEVMQRVGAALDKAGVPYMLTGSFASVFYGSPRSTQDIDIVIAATPAELQALVTSLPTGEYYIELGAALEAQQRESLFNVIDLKTGWKIDMIICKSRAFSQEEFSRRRLILREESPIWIASAEDIILSKLEWAKLGSSQRQIEDAAAILKIRGASLDRAYLDRWIRDLGVLREWSVAQCIAGISASGDPDEDE